MKTTEWFRHDANAHTDPKVMRLLSLGGLAAYGLWWYVVELLRQADGYRIDCECIEHICRTQGADRALFDHLVTCGLIVVECDHFFSRSLVERMEAFDEIREKRRNSGRIGGQASAKQMLSKCSDSVPSKGRPSRVEWSRVEKSIPPSGGAGGDLCGDAVDSDLDRQEPVGVLDTTKLQSRKPAKVLRHKAYAYSPEFETFWSAYPRRVGKGAAWRAWMAQKPPGMDVLLPSIDRAKKTEQWARDGGQYIPHPATWINGRRWEDEATTITQPDGEWKKIKEL